MESKKLEISKEQKQVSSSSVVSKVAGVVKEINEKGVDSNGNSAPFMTILQTGEYRIKGSIDEQNVWMLSRGAGGCDPFACRQYEDVERNDREN